MNIRSYFHGLYLWETLGLILATVAAVIAILLAIFNSVVWWYVAIWAIIAGLGDAQSIRQRKQYDSLHTEYIRLLQESTKE